MLTKFTLKNKNSMEVELTNIGASIIGIKIPIGDTKIDVALGYDSAKLYEKNPFYFGSIIGRFANRIAGSSFKLNEKTINIDKNEGENSLHSGNNSYCYRLWTVKNQNLEENSIVFSLNSPDGDQGFPGQANIEVKYTLTNENCLIINYSAKADKPTIFNLTNHTYFNLDGHDKGSIENHSLWLDCNKFTVIDSACIPTGGLRSVKGTAMDFTQKKLIGKDINSDYEQIKIGQGYDHNFVINSPSLDKPFAKVFSKNTQVEMQVYTNQPGVQFYSGNHLKDNIECKGGIKYTKRGGFCLETQNFPDAINHNNFPTPIYEPGKIYKSTTIYQLLF